MSRVNYKMISNKEAVPVIKHGLFSNNPTARFGTVCFGLGLYPDGCDRELFLNYLRLRKNVYINQTGMLDQSLELSDGTEIDDDDKRSIHIAVMENRSNGRVAVVACLRLILKESENQKLPVEEFYDDIFDRNPAPIGSAELSRFISRAERGQDNYNLIFNLCGATVAYAKNHGMKAAYGVIEEELEVAMSKFGIFLNRIAEPKMVEEYNDINLGVVLDLAAIENHLRTVNQQFSLEFNSPLFWGDFNS